MKIDQKVIARLDELVEMGEKSVGPLQHSEFGADYRNVETSISYQFGTSSLNLLSRVFGEESQHFKMLDLVKTRFHDLRSVEQGVATLKAAKDDYENGYLFNVREVVEAEVFDDFLEQAQQLFDKGYHAPAAVVAGCVLEDGLKKLCAKNGITLPPKATMNPANDELAKKGVYNSLTQKKILALADLRNKAAHGQWSDFTKQDVQDMIKDVRSFLEQHYV